MSDSIGQKIRKIREAKGLSREDFCYITRIRFATLTQIETGRTKNPSVETPIAVCKAFPEFTLWLMTDTTNPEAGQIAPKEQS